MMMIIKMILMLMMIVSPSSPYTRVKKKDNIPGDQTSQGHLSKGNEQEEVDRTCDSQQDAAQQGGLQ